MGPLTTTALSGLQAAQARLNSAANNIANAQTTDYRREQVVSQSRPGGGVSTQVEKLPEPGADLLQDTVDQMSASYAYKANLQVIKTSERMAGALLDTRA
jgi:flagellar hook protein FlgE